VAGINSGMTFEELTSIYSVELRSNALSEVRRDLYPAMTSLYKEQISRCDALARKDPDSIMFDGAVSRKKNIKKYMKMVAELRMKKIADMAVRGAMGAVNNPVQLLTPEERTFHDSTMKAAAAQWSIVDGKKSTVVPDIVGVTAVPETPPVDIPEDEPFDEPVFEQVPEEPQEAPQDAAAEDAQNETQEYFSEEAVVIRVLEDLPRFSGPGRDYDLRKEDVVRMPAVMARALVNRDKAEMIRVTL